MSKALKELIQGQKIRIDAHKRGVCFDWMDNAIHIHKTTLRGKDTHIAMYIYLNKDGELFAKNDKTSDADKKALIKEVTSVLMDNRAKATALCNYIIENLWNDPNSTEEHLYEVIDHIAKQFDLPIEGANTLRSDMEKAIKRYKEAGKTFSISIGKDNSVTLQEDID